MRKSKRRRISRSTCAAIFASRSVRVTSLKKRCASVRLSSVTPAIDWPFTVTASTSGLSRWPWQAWQGTSRRNSAQRSRRLSLSASAYCRSMKGMTPSKPLVYFTSRPKRFFQRTFTLKSLP